MHISSHCSLGHNNNHYNHKDSATEIETHKEEFMATLISILIRINMIIE